MKKAVLNMFMFLLPFSLMAQGEFQYVGAKKCMMCHKGQSRHLVWEKWLESRHAQAFKVLDPAKGEDKDESCLRCHTTGFKAGGYAVGASNAADFEGVGCEVCHGPGSAYKSMAVMKDRNQAIAKGLIIPDEKTCTACHNSQSPHYKGFDYQDYLKKIDHRYSK